MKNRLPLALLAFMSLAAVYVWAIPPLEGSDETEHFAYVTWLAEGKGFPPQGKAAWKTPARQEASQPPLYYALAAVPARLVGTQPPAIFRPNPHFRYELDPTLPDNKNSALHYPADTRPLRGAWLALYFARGVSVLSGLMLVVCVYGLAQAAMPDRPGAPLAAALFAAFMPQVLFHSSHVSNDVLAAAMSALTLWLLARLLRHGLEFGRAVAVGVVLGLAALTKVNTLILALPVLLAFGWLWWQRRPDRLRLLQAALGLAAAFLLVAGWWFGRAWWLYGTPLGLDTHCYQAWATCSPATLRWPLPVQWRDVFFSFWAAFGLANIRPYDWVYAIFGLLLLAALAGLLWAFGRWRRRQRPLDTEVILRIVLASAVLGNVLLLEWWLQQVLATYGRLLFPSLAAFVVLLVDGLWVIRPRLARVAWLAPAVLACLSPFWLIRPAYRPPQLLTAAEVAALGEPIGWRFGDFAELLNVTPQARSVSAGDILPVQVCWRARQPAEQNYTMLLHLVGPGNAVVARRYTYPGLGSYPTTIWEPGIAFCDVVRVPIPADLAQTLVYRVEIGWLDDATGQRLPAFAADGRPLTTTFAAVARLATATPRESLPEPAGDAAIRLADFEVDTVWQPGQSYDLTLTWWAAETVPVDYTVFIHLRDESGRPIAQADGPPLDGWYPTSWWTAGETIIDSHTFALPVGVPAGRYDLVVGWYEPATGTRLGEEYPLVSIDVRPQE